MKNNNIDIAIVGVSGYTGLELIKILINHPNFNIVYVSNSEGGIDIDELHPMLNGICNMKVQKADANEIAKVAKLVFLALPHKASMGFAKQLIAKDLKVIDLSADYRLELKFYEKYYCTHEDKKNLPLSVYGLPEFYK
jgi:N-acetyl-gamma-glutamyl-phosphate reductase